LVLLALGLGHVADADARLVVEDGADPLAIDDRPIGCSAEVDDEVLGRFRRPVADYRDCEGPGGLAAAMITSPDAAA